MNEDRITPKIAQGWFYFRASGGLYLCVDRQQQVQSRRVVEERVGILKESLDTEDDELSQALQQLLDGGSMREQADDRE